MSKSNTFENMLLLYVFNGVDMALEDDLDVALHTADPGEAGSAQTTSEAAYTGYARVALSRLDASDFTVTGNSASPAADIVFPEATGGTETITHFTVGSDGVILYRGTLTPNIAVSTGVTPKIKSTSTITED